MHKHASTCLEAILDELIRPGKVFEYVLVVYIIDFYDHVLVVCEEVVFQRETQRCEHMCNIALF